MTHARALKRCIAQLRARRIQVCPITIIQACQSQMGGAHPKQVKRIISTAFIGSISGR